MPNQFTIGVYVLAVSVWLAIPGSGTHEALTFSVVEVDGSRVGKEPVISVSSSGILNLAGAVGAGDGNFWRKQTSWTYENPTSTGGADAVAHTTPNEVFFAELNSGANEVQTSRRTSSWESTAAVSGAHDRPWFAYYNGETYLVTSLDQGANPRKMQIRKTTTGASWTTVNDNVGSGGAANLTIYRDGKFYLPYEKDSQTHMAISTNQGTSWSHELVISSDPQNPPFGAVDEDGNAYIVWTDGSRVFYRIRWVNNGTWSADRAASSSTTASTWGSMGVSGGVGRLGIAWYTKEPSGDWEVHYVHVSSADSSQHLSQEKTVWIASEGTNDAFDTFQDFLTVARKSDGNVLIAFSCNWSTPSNLPPCTDNGQSHPMLAEQTGGPTV